MKRTTEKSRTSKKSRTDTPANSKRLWHHAISMHMSSPDTKVHPGFEQGHGHQHSSLLQKLSLAVNCLQKKSLLSPVEFSLFLCTTSPLPCQAVDGQHKTNSVKLLEISFLCLIALCLGLFFFLTSFCLYIMMCMCLYIYVCFSCFLLLSFFCLLFS